MFTYFAFILFAIVGLAEKSRAVTFLHPVSNYFVASLELAKLDGWILAPLIALAAYASAVRRRSLSFVVAGPLWIAGIWYLLDALSLSHFDRHATPQGVYSLVIVPGAVLSQIFTIAPYFFSIPLVAGAARFFRPSGKFKYLILPALVFFVVSFLPRPTGLTPMAFSESFRITEWRTTTVTDRDIRSVLGSDPESRITEAMRIAGPPDINPDIILLTLESFSLALSRGNGGTRNYFPRFDRQLGEGTRFTNFFAAGENSFVAATAMYYGMLPLAYAHRHNNLHDVYALFRDQPSILSSLKKLGYQTHYACSDDFWYSHTRIFASAVGFDEEIDPVNTPAMLNYPRFHYQLSDEALYDTVLARLARAANPSRPQFWALHTLESHDYADREREWQRVDRKLTAFIGELERRDYFSHGILIVTGDHHLRAGYPSDFSRREGPVGRARIPLFIRGKGVRKGVTDERYFMQSDLLRHLKTALTTTDRPLSPRPIFLDDSRGIFPTRILAIESGSALEATVSGLNTYWKDRSPRESKRFEADIAFNQAVQHYRRNDYVPDPERKL